MDENVAEIKEHLERLEGYGSTAPDGDNLRLKGFDYLLHSILNRQGHHNADLRMAVQGQERMQSSMNRTTRTLDSIEQTMRDIHRKVQILVDKREAR